jgi:signal transduction histidine kinase
LKANHKRSRWLLGFLLIATTGLLIFGGLFVQDALRQRLPDGPLLETGSADGWKPYGGAWETKGDVIHNDSSERGAKFIKGSSHWGDYTFESDLESLGQNGRVGLIVRSTNEERGVDSYSGYYVGLRWPDSRMIIGRSDYGWAEYAHVSLKTVLQPLHWYHLKVVAVGCTIAAQFTDPSTGETSSISANDTSPHCAKYGRVGLRSLSTFSAWKNISIHPATTKDLRPLLEAVNPTEQESPPVTIQDKLDNFKEFYADTVSQPNSGIAGPTVPIDELRVASVLGTDVLSVRGKVILTSPALFVQDSTGGVFIPNVETAKLNIGDEVLARGQAIPHPFSSEIRDAQVTMLWPSIADPPFSITSFQAATGAFDARFVELQGDLDSTNVQQSRRVSLELSDGDQRFQALLEASSAKPALSLPAHGSRLQIRGVCVTSLQYTKREVPFVILLRSPDDIKVINGPPWWSARNLISGVVVALIISLLGYILYARAEQWRRQAVIEERLRLAHDLHDTMAQSFAGIGFQLRAILKKLPGAPDPLREQVEITSELVRQGHQEARRSISTLRNDANRDHIELLPALIQVAERMISDDSIVVETSASGTPRRIPLKLADVLFRVGQEAIANVIRHANASRIRIHLDYGRNKLQFAIEDNGTGFTLDDANAGGFGLNGIRERVLTVGGTVQITSSPGMGTRLAVETPLPPLTLLFQLLPWLEINGKH